MPKNKPNTPDESRPANEPAKPELPRTHAQEKRDRAKQMWISRLEWKDLNTSEQVFLAVAQWIFRHNTGSSTPFLAFIGSCVRFVEWDNWPTPDELREEVNRFEEDWNDTITTARQILERHPDVIAEELALASLRQFSKPPEAKS